MFNVYLIITRKRTSDVSVSVTTVKTDLAPFKSHKAAVKALEEYGWVHGKHVIIAQCESELQNFELGYGIFMKRPKGGHVYYERVLQSIWTQESIENFRAGR